MDKNIDFSNFGGYPPFDTSDPENFFNPMTQYEQGYMYYKCLCMQMDYKIKCKEYERMCNGKVWFFMNKEDTL